MDFQNLKKHSKFNLIAASTIVVLLIFAVAVASIKNINTQKAVTSEHTEGFGYPSLFYHYTSFNEKANGSIKLGWQKNRIRLINGKAETKMLVSIFPVGLKNKELVFKSSNNDIAQIDKYGNITATKPGTVHLSVTLKQSGQTEVAELQIIEPVKGILIEKTNLVMNITDAWQQLRTTIYPSNASIRDIIWSSSDSKVAVIDENGTLKPVGIGMTQITAKSKDGGYESKCFVTVVNKTIPVTDVIIQNKGGEKISVGEKMDMIAAVIPSNASNKIVSWTSSDENVAKVSKTGKITAIGEGSAKITVASSSGKKDTMTLTVSPATSQSALDLNNKVTSNHVLSTSILGSTYINNRSSASMGDTVYTSYNISLKDIVNIQMNTSPPPKIWKNGGTVYASREETTEYMNPACYYSGVYKYQFLDLSSSNGISVDELNSFLADKGILAGHGQAFADAASELNISEVYLVAHACLETGNGTSILSTGVEVNGTTVYNMYGIGAYDNSALASGSQNAYQNGWTSPDAAIKGGAKWISEHYINASPRQNTLYKMLWNPETPGEHQYATGIDWAVKQALNIDKIFSSFPNASLAFDIPVYSGEIAITVD